MPRILDENDISEKNKVIRQGSTLGCPKGRW